MGDAPIRKVVSIDLTTGKNRTIYLWQLDTLFIGPPEAQKKREKVERDALYFRDAARSCIAKLADILDTITDTELEDRLEDVRGELMEAMDQAEGDG